MGNENLICKICNSNSVFKSDEIHGYRSSTTFNIFECKNCKTSFADPCLADNKIYDVIYKNIENIPGYSRYFHLAEKLMHEKDPLNFIMGVDDCYFAIAKSLIDRIEDKSESLIYEVGCGQGYLTYALVKAGYKSIGLDISSEAIALANKRYGNHYVFSDLNKFIEDGGAKPKYIISSEVIEHLSDPVLFISEMLDSLNTGGSLILTTPNKLTSGNQPWNTELPPVHLWWFTRNSLVEIAKKLSSDIEFVDLTEFYKKHSKYRTDPDNVTPSRNPVLAEDYTILEPIANNYRFKLFNRILNKILPKILIRKIQDIRMKSNGYYMCEDSTALTLCAIFTKRLQHA